MGFHDLYSRIDNFFQRQEGLYGSKAFMAAVDFWPISLIIIFGRYGFYEDRRPLGDLQWVWQMGRAGIVIMSVLCLIFYRWAKMREWLGHSIFIYTVLAMVSYYIEIKNHDEAFQNDMLGIFGVSMALYIMTMMSYALLREKRKWETHELKAS